MFLAVEFQIINSRVQGRKQSNLTGNIKTQLRRLTILFLKTSICFQPILQTHRKSCGLASSIVWLDPWPLRWIYGPTKTRQSRFKFITFLHFKSLLAGIDTGKNVGELFAYRRFFKYQLSSEINIEKHFVILLPYSGLTVLTMILTLKRKTNQRHRLTVGGKWCSGNNLVGELERLTSKELEIWLPYRLS